MELDVQLSDLKRALAANPTNLELAWRYWKALGSWNGSDIRSGMYVHETFRAAALQSPAGVAAFAHAYRELFEASGEGPRKLDPAISRCAESAIAKLTGSERADVEWLLKSVDKKAGNAQNAR